MRRGLIIVILRLCRFIIVIRLLDLSMLLGISIVIWMVCCVICSGCLRLGCRLFVVWLGWRCWVILMVRRLLLFVLRIRRFICGRLIGMFSRLLFMAELSGLGRGMLIGCRMGIGFWSL